MEVPVDRKLADALQDYLSSYNHPFPYSAAASIEALTKPRHELRENLRRALGEFEKNWLNRTLRRTSEE